MANSKGETRARVGLFGIRLEAYWSQFDGLKERLEGYRRHVEEQLGRWAQVFSLNIGDTNSRLRFSLPLAEFMNAWCEGGPTHQCALGTGHQAGELGKVARLPRLEFVEVG